MNLVIGAGAVGTILSAYLSLGHQAPKLFVRDKDKQRLQSLAELKVSHVASGRAGIQLPKPALSTSLDLGDTRFVFLCVKFPDLDPVLDQLPHQIPENCEIVSTLNGVAAVRHIRERFPQARVTQMNVMFNAQLIEPLHARITTRPQVVIDRQNRALAALFDDSGMQVLRGNGEAAAWGKLLINLANGLCALTHTTFKDLFLPGDLRRCYAAVFEEAMQTLRAAAVDYQFPVRLPPPLYLALLKRGGPLPWWFAKYRNGLRDGSYPSMVADVVAGRPTEVDQLNGEIARLAQSMGRSARLNEKVVQLIQDLQEQHPPRYLRPEALLKALND